jgi:hypothetical protein
MIDSASAAATAKSNFGREAFPSLSKKKDLSHGNNPAERDEARPSNIVWAEPDFSTMTHSANSETTPWHTARE